MIFYLGVLGLVGSSIFELLLTVNTRTLYLLYVDITNSIVVHYICVNE